MKPELIAERLKKMLWLFIVCLVLSGLTAFPLEQELAYLNSLQTGPVRLQHWIAIVYNGIKETNTAYPFMAYGTDWLAFAHLAIAVFFIGPLKDPVRNKWILQAGMIVSVGIFPLAFIAGPLRGIPFYWQLIDCSFGVFGFLLLYLCYTKIVKLEKIELNKNVGQGSYAATAF